MQPPVVLLGLGAANSCSYATTAPQASSRYGVRVNPIELLHGGRASACIATRRTSDDCDHPLRIIEDTFEKINLQVGEGDIAIPDGYFMSIIEMLCIKNVG